MIASLYKAKRQYLSFKVRAIGLQLAFHFSSMTEQTESPFNERGRSEHCQNKHYQHSPPLLLTQ